MVAQYLFLAQVLLLPFRIEKWMPKLFFLLSSDGTRLAWKKGKKQIQLEKKGERGYRSALSFHVFAAALPFLNKTVLTLYQSVHFTGTPCLDFFLCTAHGHYQGARRRGFWLGCTSRHIETVLWALSWQNVEINCAKPSLGLSSTPPCSNSSTCKPLDQCLKLLLGLSYLRISVSN